MSDDLMFAVTVFVLGALVGFEVISKVPATLHPADVRHQRHPRRRLAGAIRLAADADGPLGYGLAFTAVAFAAANVVGGYVVTDRMLRMFRPRRAVMTAPAMLWAADLTAAVLFVVGLHLTNRPATARRGTALRAGHGHRPSSRR
ncbi:hypothetical protein GCM10020218_058140 [Dactylosporangium vinaceum]